MVLIKLDGLNYGLSVVGKSDRMDISSNKLK